MAFDFDYYTASYLFHNKSNIVQSCFFQKNKELSSSNTIYLTKLSVIIKNQHNIVKISAYSFIAMSSKNNHQDIALWLNDFEELRAFGKDKDI